MKPSGTGALSHERHFLDLRLWIPDLWRLWNQTIGSQNVISINRLRNDFVAYTPSDSWSGKIFKQIDDFLSHWMAFLPFHE
jgi:hypothetical protein